MQYSHPIDRLAVKLRPALLVLVALWGPTMLISYGLMLKSAFETWPWWGFALTIASHVMGWLGISALIDTRREQTHRTSDGQS